MTTAPVDALDRAGDGLATLDGQRRAIPFALPGDDVRQDGETLTLGDIAITAHATPGHTPGAMSWSWRSCENDICRTIVYADSLSAVSSDSYRFSAHPDYVASFRQSLQKVAALECDILLTPHPSGSGMRGKTLTGNFHLGTDCESYAGRAMRNLDARLNREAEGEQ